MFRDYLLATGFRFQDHTQELLIDKLLQSNPKVRDKLVNLLLSAQLKLNHPDVIIYQKQTQQQLLSLIQQQCSVYNKLNRINKQLSQSVKQQSETVSKAIKSLELNAQSLTKSWPEVVDSVSLLREKLQKSLQFEYEDGETLSLNKLNQYMKAEKRVLESLAEDIERSSSGLETVDKKKAVSATDLHRIRNKQIFEQILQDIKIHKLKAQIEYLEQNVLTSNNLIIYNPKVVKIKEPINDFTSELKELERLIEIRQSTGECRQGGLRGGERILETIKRQYARQKAVASLLSEEGKKVQAQLNSIESMVLDMGSQNREVQKSDKLYEPKGMQQSAYAGLWTIVLSEADDVGELKVPNILQKVDQLQSGSQSLRQVGASIDQLRERIRRLQKSRDK